jgi:hypothetical protein
MGKTFRDRDMEALIKRTSIKASKTLTNRNEEKKLVTREMVIQKCLPSSIIFALGNLGFSKEGKVSLDYLTNDNAYNVKQWIDSNVSGD